jgi:hypothetical protein
MTNIRLAPVAAAVVLEAVSILLRYVYGDADAHHEDM